MKHRFAILLFVFFVAAILAWLVLRFGPGTAAMQGHQHVEQPDATDVAIEPVSSESPPDTKQETESTSPSADSNSTEPDIFTEIDESLLDPGVLDAFLKDRPVVRYRIVTIDTDSIRAQIRDEYDDEIYFNLFDDLQFTAIAQSQKIIETGRGMGFSSWGGRVDGREHFGFVILTIGHNDIMTGSFRGSFGVYRINDLVTPGHHVIWERDRSVPHIID